jgi:hypothetical protein
LTFTTLRTPEFCCGILYIPYYFSECFCPLDIHIVWQNLELGTWI